VNDIGEGHALKYLGYEVLQKYELINKFKVTNILCIVVFTFIDIVHSVNQSIRIFLSGLSYRAIPKSHCKGICKKLN